MWGSSLIGNYAAAGHALAGSAMGGIGRAAMYGGMAGGAYGALSSNTSVLGGALMGAGLGAGGMRYGGGARSMYGTARKAGMDQLAAGTYAAGFGGRMMASDVSRGASLVSNYAVNRFSALSGGRMFGGMGGGY